MTQQMFLLWNIVQGFNNAIVLLLAYIDIVCIKLH